MNDKYHIVQKALTEGDMSDVVPVKIFSTRKRAQEYSNVMNDEHPAYFYWVYEKGVKLG